MNGRRIKILQVKDSQGIYGAERVIMTLGKHIDPGKFGLTLLCLHREGGPSGRLIEAARKSGIPVISLPVRGMLDFSAIREMRRIIRAQRIEVVHSHDYKSDLYSLLATLDGGVKRISTAHGSTRESMRKRLYLFVTEKILYFFFDRIIAVSSEIHRQLRGGAIRKSAVCFIPNGLDPNLLNGNGETGRDEELFTRIKGETVFAVVGRLSPDKGHRYFLRALAGVCPRYPGARAVLAGDGPHREAIRREIEELGLENRVQFLGFCHNMKSVYENIDFLVIPSLREGLPYTLLEAMERKIPLIATAVGEIPRLVKNGVTGFLVPAGDAEALKEKMIKGIKNPGESREMAERAHLLISEGYSADKMTKKTEELYEGLLRGRKGTEKDGEPGTDKPSLY